MSRSQPKSQTRLLYPTPNMVLWGVLVFVLVYGIFYVGRIAIVQSGYFKIERIKVTGNHYLSEKNIQDIAKVDLNQSMFAINLANITDMLLENSYLLGVSVSRVLPSTLLIDVQEREPLMYLADQAVYMVDESGMILKKLPRMMMGKLPIVTGLSQQQVSTDSSRLQAAVNLIKKIQEVDASLLPLISEINFQKNRTAPELVLIKGAARVRIGADHHYQRIFLLSELLRKQPVMDHLPGIRMIDMTFSDRIIVQNKT